MSTFKREKDESIDEFFTRIYQTVKARFPSADIWLAQQTGKRFSYVKGDTSNAFSPLRIEISQCFWVLICDNSYQEEIRKTYFE